MKRMVDSILRQHGTPMVLLRGEEALRVKGFFQPVRSKSLQSVVSHSTPLGQMDRGQFVYIGPGDVAVEEGDELALGDQRYVFRRTEVYRYSEEIVYTWGLCMEKGRDEEWEIR